MSKLNVYILLDRTGSMQSRWTESLSSINTYVDELKKDNNSKITVACFDFQGKLEFDILRDSVKIKDFKPITNKDASPRGMTPLYDAVSKIVSMAETADKKQTVIVIVTDGYENSSRETNLDGAKACVKRCKEKDWQVVFLGADFNATAQADAVGVSAANTLNMKKGHYAKAMMGLAGQTRMYATSKTPINFTDKDRSEAGSE